MTAGEAGWHKSRYNVYAQLPGTDKVVIVNLYKGNCAVYSPLELYLLNEIEGLDSGHPIIDRFKKRGIIANFDERAALLMMGRAACTGSRIVSVTICPTMACNFDCPYCFERHAGSKMSEDIMEDVILLVRRMIETFAAKKLDIRWFGGEPLLAVDVIESLSERLISLAGEYGAEYSAGIITNGYLLGEANIRMLERVKVSSAQVTLDGIGAAHDMTRHLVGGGATFEKITSNLRDNKMSFDVNIRHNVHSGNADQVKALRAFVEELASDSGNNLRYYPSHVSGNARADARGGVRLLCGESDTDIAVEKAVNDFKTGSGIFCGAHILSSVGIDEKGRLYKCWEDVDTPAHSFGTAAAWNPMEPITTADNPDALTCYMNTVQPYDDPECAECVWLPHCIGGCPNKRLYYERECVPYRNMPERYVLAMYEKLRNSKKI